MKIHYFKPAALKNPGRRCYLLSYFSPAELSLSFAFINWFSAVFNASSTSLLEHLTKQEGGSVHICFQPAI